MLQEKRHCLNERINLNVEYICFSNNIVSPNYINVAVGDFSESHSSMPEFVISYHRVKDIVLSYFPQAPQSYAPERDIAVIGVSTQAPSRMCQPSISQVLLQLNSKIACNIY